MNDNYVHGLIPPPNVDPAWECVSMSNANAGPILRQHTVPGAWNDPSVAVAWFDIDSQLRLLAAEFCNGRRVVLRRRPDRSWNVTMTTISLEPRRSLARQEAA